MRTSPWLLRRPGPRRALRLYCFSYAGGSPAGYLAWQAALDPEIEVCAVQLPGRGARFNEASCTELAQLVATLAAVIGDEAEQPFAFFGHSLGALIAFEVARALAAGGRAQPCHLFLSGCAAPRYRPARPAIHRFDDAALLRELADYNGTPPELLAHAELMALLLPAIRADFALVHDYAYRPARLLDLPLTVLAGDADRIGSSNEVTGWSEETRGPCRVRWFAGDHFFLHACTAQVLDCITNALDHLTEPAL
jgi:surfactin synthase thioesterase subunit